MARKRATLTIALVAVACAMTPASATIVPPGLMEAVAAYDRAETTSDRAALERLLADDFLLVDSSGRERERDEFIADLTAPGYRMQPYAVQHPIVRTSRNSAIMGGVALVTGVDGGKPFERCMRFVDIWSRRPDGWKMGYSQALRLDPGPCAAK